jgi:hypothetical protein
MARCGHPLPREVLQHERLPSRHLCQECFTAHLLPEPVFSQTPIGRRLSAPGLADGGPDPASPRPRLTAGRALPHRFGFLVVSRFQTTLSSG